jgi:hypothetical protein
MFEGRARAEGRDSEQPPHLRRGAHQALESSTEPTESTAGGADARSPAYSPRRNAEPFVLPPDPQGSNDVKEPPHQLVAGEIRCIECRCLWVLPQERWRVFLTDEDQPEPVAYCPACAKREFD